MHECVHRLTGERVDTNLGTHLLKMHSENWVFVDFISVFLGKILETLLKYFHLVLHLRNVNDSVSALLQILVRERERERVREKERERK
jgi:hypothetical protein